MKEKIKADMLLVHAPAYFDFRKENKIYFPFMSTSGDVPITPVYEFYPLGFKTLKEYICERGHDVKIFNLCSCMLQNKDMDIVECLKEIDAEIVGIDLHWMVHVQGALETAKIIKELHKDTYILLGGISSSYYAKELIEYPFVDMVMRGYDTHMPMEKTVDIVKNGGDLSNVPNLLWKREGKVIDNGLTYKPGICTNGVNWSDLPQNSKSLLPMLDIVSTTNVGCANNCGWCGGSHKAFKRLYDGSKSPVFKEDVSMAEEFSTLKYVKDIKRYNFYSCGNYNLSDKKFMKYLDELEPYHFKSVNYEEYRLLGEDVLKKMVEVNPKTIITLSPESHDQHISKLSGRGHYSMEEMEEWITRALEIGIEEVDIWFFIGMPEQDEKSVMETVSYCGHLLEKFQGEKVVPMICPMMPFLDPASEFFEHPEEHGYHIFYKTVEEHRQGMQRASIINRLNYETKWLSRSQIVHVGYRAIKELFLLKGKYGVLPNSIIEGVVKKIDDTVAFIDKVHEIDCLEDVELRNQELEKISAEIYERNQQVFFYGVMNQAFPIARPHGERWFDYV